MTGEVEKRRFVALVILGVIFLFPYFLLDGEEARAQLTKYDIPFSVSLDGSAEYFDRSPSLMGSSTRWTLSAWVKRAGTTNTDTIFAAVSGSTYSFKLFFNSSGAINMTTTAFDCSSSGGITAMNKISTATYTSTTVWYHIVVAVDTTQATAGNRNRLYVDGTEITSFSTDTNITQNTNTCVTRSLDPAGAAVSHRVGAGAGGDLSPPTPQDFLQGDIAEPILVDGKQLTPSSFAFTDGATWTPIEFVGATGTTNGPFGTNGFRLDFASSTLLGNDRSGRNNDFTANSAPTQTRSTPTGQLSTSTNIFAPSGQTIFSRALTIRGNLSISFNLSKGNGSFVIDHPLDPLNKLLYHQFLESPDMKNVYDGVAQLNDNGEAAVELPGYFLALNSDFRYLGTAIGQSMPNLHLVKEVRPRWWGWFGTPVFKISGGVPGGRISWQVTGVRKDLFAKENPIRTEVEKGPNELVDKGEYLYPELYR